ncbi:MAG: 3-hydroxyacyl-ACP dehydratase FabZ [Neisseriaceae bacterium]|nr:MAG: 3-hydroxyacyl-ACP dehydratase FabZ [Neisseriaceae bacterium]
MSEQLDVTQLNILDIMKRLPHRYPFLLVDRVTEVKVGETIRAIKNVTINEPFFVGHFADFPVMPGVLIVEAMAQVAGLLSVLSYGERKENELYFFAAIDKARFKRQVTPGDQLIFEVDVIKVSRGIGKFKAVAKVDGQVAAEAEIMIAKKEV